MNWREKNIYIFSTHPVFFQKKNKKNVIPNISLKKTCIYMPVCMCVYIYLIYIVNIKSIIQMLNHQYRKKVDMTKETGQA